MAGEEIASGHGEEVDSTIDPPSRVEGGLPGNQREQVGTEVSGASDRQDQPSRDGLEISRQRDLESSEHRSGQDTAFIQHLRPDDRQPPLVPIGEVTSYRYKGPIPDPGMLARYNEVDPTFADRIMKMAEAEVYANTDAIRDLSSADSLAVRWGAIAAVGITAVGLIGTVVLIILGYSAIAVLTAIPALLYGLSRVIEAARSRAVEPPLEDEIDKPGPT
jgi:uncharacterized membrane protein